MTQTQDFFVFITADPQLRGLSLLRTGENLPRLIGGAWLGKLHRKKAQA